MTHPLLSAETGRRELLLGDEAVVRGAIEAGVQLVSGYPGTPASEIGDTFHRLSEELGIAFEYSVNEKVALELAFGASLAGARTLVSMKHLGLNYAADPLSTMPYIGVVGGMVIVSAADPGCLTSPNEQDQRHLGRMVGLPTLDPATPDETRRMTFFAFELSERCELPVLLRMTTRVCHTRAAVEFGRLPATRRAKPVFRRNPARFLPVPTNARRMRHVLERRLTLAEEILDASPFNRVTGPVTASRRPVRGIVAAGVPRNAVLEALVRAGVEAPVLEIGALHPLPESFIAEFLARLADVLVVEELSPYVEDAIAALAHRHGLAVRVRGKRDGSVQPFHELEMDEVERAVRAFLELPARAAPLVTFATDLVAPPRPPVLCPGCPHRNTFHAVTSVFGDRAVYVNDIGCYTLGAAPPHGAGDALLAMGSSIPMAAGIARVTGERTVAFIGDSTFFHSGMPPLVDAALADDDVVVVVMDNHVTAMTGLQPCARRDIAEVARALGAKDVTTVDVTDVGGLVRAFERAKAAHGLSVIVAEGPCALLPATERDAVHEERPQVDPSRCGTCGMDDAGLYCGLGPLVAVQRRVAAQRAVHAAANPGAGPVPDSSPCSLECPLGICIPAYVGAIAAGEEERGLAAITLRAALPSVCAYVCHRPCESACVRAATDRPIAVNALKRHLTDRRLKPVERRDPPEGPAVAIVGAGPAGLAAARELVRRGLAPTLFDAHDRPGGMLEHAIPEYRLPRDVLRRDVDAVLAEGVHFEGRVRLGRDVTIGGLRERGFGVVVLALGTQRATRPPIDGAHLVGVAGALVFLADPPDLTAGRVVVVGGGDAAIDCARTALRRGAASVHMVFPESESEIAAAPDAVDGARAEGVALLGGRAALEVIGDAQDRVSAVRLGHVAGFARGAGDDVMWERADPAETLPATCVVFATGLRPALDGIDVPTGVVSAPGGIETDAYGRTAVPWFFAAGDVASGATTVTEAMAAGVRTAWAVHALLAGGREVPPPSAPPPRTARRAGGHGRTSGVTELSAAEAQDEARRCLLCGMCRNCRMCVELLGCPAISREGRDGLPHIDPVLCNACGACVRACPNEAIGAGA